MQCLLAIPELAAFFAPASAQQGTYRPTGIVSMALGGLLHQMRASHPHPATLFWYDIYSLHTSTLHLLAVILKSQLQRPLLIAVACRSSMFLYTACHVSFGVEYKDVHASRLPCIYHNAGVHTHMQT